MKIFSRLYRNRLVNDSFWAIFGNVVSKGLGLASGIIIARILGKEIYGEYGVIRNTLMSVAVFSTFGLGYTATKFIAENIKNNSTIIPSIINYARYITLIVSGIMALGLLFASTYLSESVLNAPHLALPLRIVSIWIVFNAVTATQIGVLAGFGDFKVIAKVNVVVGFITFFTGLLFTYFFGLNGALSSLLLAQIINCILNYYEVTKKTVKIEKFDQKNSLLFKEVIQFSLPVAIQEGFYSLTTWFPNFLLIKMSTYGEVGLYSAAMQWNAIILFIPGILRNVIFSHLTHSYKNKQRHYSIIKTTLTINLLTTLVPFLFVFIFSKKIETLYGVSFDGLSSILGISVFATIFVSLGSVYKQAYMACDKNWTMLFFQIIRNILFIIISYFFLEKYSGKNGGVYVSFSFLISFIVFLIIVSTFYHATIIKKDDIKIKQQFGKA